MDPRYGFSIVISIVVIVAIGIGYAIGSINYRYIKVNSAVRVSLESRTAIHLSKLGYNQAQYKMKTVKGLKSDGMKDYDVDVQFHDDPGHHYYYSENSDGQFPKVDTMEQNKLSENCRVTRI